MSRFIPCILAVLACLAGTPLPAQTGSTVHPGVIDFNRFFQLDGTQIVTEINLRRTLLRIAGQVAAKENPAFARAIENVELIQVRVIRLDEGHHLLFQQGIVTLQSAILDRGWENVVKHQEGTEKVSIHILPGPNGGIEGLAVLVLEPAQAVVINIAGSLDLDAIAAIGAGMDLDVLENMGQINRQEP